MERDLQKATRALDDFIRYTSSPWRIVWTNLLAGIFRGLGTVIGASIVLAIIFWILTLFAKLPIIGEYATQIKTTVTRYVKNTDYHHELNRLGDSLERIESDLKDQ
ncbi:MAG TPA: hypothetical protein EYH35_00375 [Thiotrichaceae bacterium]|nr:hypothetical protein [Thiotrichaceae bacterium]